MGLCLGRRGFVWKKIFGFDMDIALRERDFDVVIAESLPDGNQYIGADVANPLWGVIDPEADL
jgi:hypothetical protein